MDQDSTHMVAASKVPMLKPGEFEIWRMRIVQYIQMMDYALWEVIKNGATLPKTQVMEVVGSYGIKIWLQKLVSQLELLDEKLSQEDVNQKLLRSLSPKWNPHAVVWRNKADLDTMSMDDLYNNLKSDQEKKGPNYALMAFTFSSSDLKVSNDSTSLKSCLETVKLLKSQNEQILKDFKKSELMILVNTDGQVNVAHSKTIVNAARSMSYLSKTAHSTVKKPIYKNTTFKNINVNQRVNTAMGNNFNTARPKEVVNAVKGNNLHAVKALAYPSQYGLGPQKKLIFLPNMQDYKEINRRYVAFRGNPKGGKITRK
nr:ribonuclease H-like domain-containing protein [Tanacetum cinerariifolium]GEY65448.1 ribonuclease H-like domain-containing protein [Tanacetum cinerariifolium]